MSNEGGQLGQKPAAKTLSLNVQRPQNVFFEKTCRRKCRLTVKSEMFGGWVGVTSSPPDLVFGWCHFGSRSLAPPREKAMVRGFSSVEQIKFPLAINRGWPFSRGGAS